MGRGVGIASSNLIPSVFGPIHDTPFGTAGDLVVVPAPGRETPIPAPGGPDIRLLLGDFHGTDGVPWECCPPSLPSPRPLPPLNDRLRPGRWAPSLADFGKQDRGSAVRICPTYAAAMPPP